VIITLYVSVTKSNATGLDNLSPRFVKPFLLYILNHIILGWGTCEMVPKSPSWGNRAGRRLRIVDDLSRGQLWISWWGKSNTELWMETPVNKQFRTASGYPATKHTDDANCSAASKYHLNTYPSLIPKQHLTPGRTTV